MSEIPYYFETPIPKYFREAGWFSNPNTILFVTWAFSKCSHATRTIVHDRKEITLSPYEFITGRGKSSADCLLSEDAFKHQLNTMQNAGLLKKTPNSTPNRFTCYIWVTDRFSKPNPQLNPQLSANWTPTERPQSRRKKIRTKEDHPSIPSVEVDGKIDDFSLNEGEEEGESKKEHNIYYQSPPSQIEVIPSVFMSQSELDKCILIKGDLEKVKYAIDFIMHSEKRKHPISDWPNALTKWKIGNKAKLKIDGNLEYAEKLCKTFHDFKAGRGFRCYLYTDVKKDQRGVLFEPESAYKEAFFVSLSDGEFEKKCYNHLIISGMIKENKG
jgi:hypothetical protein